MLVKIVNTLYHHSTIQNQILSTFNDELKIRPTYSEIISFVAKRSEPEVVDKTYMALDVLENVTSELDRKFEITASINRDQVEDYTNKLKTFRDITMENFRKISLKVDKRAQERKSVIKLIRNWTITHHSKTKQREIFSKWKRCVQNQKKSKLLLKKIILNKDLTRQKRAWNRLKGAYLLMRMKKFEGNSIKALLRADDCQSKMLSILPEIISMKQNKANTDDLLKLASAVERTNYESVYSDLVGMIKEESKGLQDQLQQINADISHQLQDFCREFRQSHNATLGSSINKEVTQLRSELSSLSNMQALVHERLARIDYCSMKEDSEFKLEVLSKQMKALESKVLNISCSQDSIADQTGYLRSLLQFNKPSSKNSIKGSSTAATKALLGEATNSSQIIDSELSVSGIYLKPNKRVSSASTGKKRIYSQQRKYRIPTSFSNTLSITETPLLLFNKGT